MYVSFVYEPEYKSSRFNCLLSSPSKVVFRISTLYDADRDPRPASTVFGSGVRIKGVKNYSRKFLKIILKIFQQIVSNQRTLLFIFIKDNFFCFSSLFQPASYIFHPGSGSRSPLIMRIRIRNNTTLLLLRITQLHRC